MDTLQRLEMLLPDEAARAMAARREVLREVRLRAGRPVQLVLMEGQWLSRSVIDGALLNRVLAQLADFSLYAREEELRQGFFTLEDGCRVGVCGRLVFDGGAVTGLSAAGSLCIRVSREVRGCAEVLLPYILRDGRILSALILSPPGLGKTTLLRELARRLSDGGHCVCVADERHELAACKNGVPTLDVGLRTDVMDGGPKALAMGHMLRACAPEVIVTDEIGGEGDARAIAEAARCGVSVICSAHGDGFGALARRRALRTVMDTGVFSLGVLLGRPPGTIQEIRLFDGEGGHAVDAGGERCGGLCAGGNGDGIGVPPKGEGADGAGFGA